MVEGEGLTRGERCASGGGGAQVAPQHNFIKQKLN